VSRARLLAFGLLMLALGGCVEPPRRTVDLIYTYERDALLQTLRRRADTISTLGAKLNIHFEGPELKGPQSCDGVLRYQAPDQVRLRGDRDFVGQVFDLASDGERYSYWFIDPETKAPREMVTGTLAGLRRRRETGLATLSLNLGEVLGLVHPPEESATTRLLVKTYPDCYIIDLVEVDGEEILPRRQWWVDRVDLTCARMEMFGEAGELVMEAELSHYERPGVGLAAVARKVRLHWPRSGESLTFELRAVKVNRPLKPSLFRLELPEGAELIEVE